MDKEKKSFIWVIFFLLSATAIMILFAAITIRIDPFIHYHFPLNETYFYTLDNERSQNDGIIKHFSYQGLITGSSMTENFKTSEAEKLFHISFIKVPFSGGNFKETHDNIENAIKYQPELKCVIRSLDQDYLIMDAEHMREDLGIYPEYLYDNNIWNDAEYLLNRQVLLQRIYPMIKGRTAGEKPGITSFDDYANWMRKLTFGKNTVYPDGFIIHETESQEVLSETEKNMLMNNIVSNVVSLAKDNPDIVFYCFYPPYSIGWWGERRNDGSFYKQMEAKRICTELLLTCDNIRLYNFGTFTDIVTDLNNYKDATHYGSWINSWILYSMWENRGLLTKDNYKQCLNDEMILYSTFDFTLLNDQEDYQDDDRTEQSVFVWSEKT